jgi:hypothetical protein
LVGNKCESEEVKIKADQINRYCGDKMKYVEISCKTCYQFEVPFLVLLEQLWGEEKVELLDCFSELQE